MANDAAKKRVKANAAALASMRIFLAVANVSYAVSMGVAAARQGPLTRGLGLWVAYLAVEGSVYAFLSTSAAPVYDAQGGLVSGGTDLASPGVIEYCRDILMVSSAAHTLCALTAWGSLLLLSVPLYAVSLAASASAKRSSNALAGSGATADGGGAEGAGGPSMREGSRKARRASARR
ncbi:hypothetical protein BU14_0032s0080 [Porphyra umbilicalis]|uniref:Transmembrane protein 208 n=1 Tax=Porphyra umbilicalis TaxID=2786 RepID=A0A1X6PIX9_PORUM|nr:hypothetical protein BU14_0032s0080 [Porphyra umbilicalis]|eukprot:OSX80821.1 hypothetical protein BU14_0032s0080 [Porphyra umbilicalis]